MDKKSRQYSATAVACANIALIKYWGKRHRDKNLPAVGSISLTLNALKTETSVRFDDTLSVDWFEMNGQVAAGRPLQRVSRFLDLIWNNDRPKARVKSKNNFVTGAGLASSASGFAALALAANRAAHKDRSRQELSQLARQGSGSAARSIFGGFVEMKCGTHTTDNDYAVGLFDENYWDVRMLIAVTTREEKKISSTDGMMRTAQTSPYYKQWVSRQPHDLAEMRDSIERKDFSKMGELTEHSCFKMHGLAMSAKPPLLYWNNITVKIINIIHRLRRNGTAAYVTIDAGPQVKIMALPKSIDKVKQALHSLSGIKELIECKPGSGAVIKSFEQV